MATISVVTPAHAQPRIDYLDLIRVLACFMVIMIHVRSGFPYILDSGNTNTGLLFYCSMLRPCVPFFIMLSGALLLPMQQDSVTFFKRRFTRVLIPFLIWSVLYVVLPAPPQGAVHGVPTALDPLLADGTLPLWLYNLVMIPLNFTYSNVHVWFIFVIIGLYLLIPVLSPWIAKAKEETLLVFLAIWTFTLCLPYLQIPFPQLHGVCDWNSFGMTYYFAGYIGYLVLGYYLVHFPMKSNAKAITIGAVLFIIGLAATYLGLCHGALEAHATAVELKAYGATPPAHLFTPVNIDRITEFYIDNLTINVGMMTAGLFMLLQRIKLPLSIRPLVTHLSMLSYGIFLVHYIIALWFNRWVNLELIPKLPEWAASPWVQMPVRAVIVFSLSWLVAVLLAKLPKSKYLIG